MYDVAANLKTPNFLGTFMAGKEAAQDARMKKMQMDAAENAAAQAAKRKTYGQGYTQSLGGNLYSGANPYKPTGDDIIGGKAFDSLKGAPAPMAPKKDFTTEGLYSAIFQDAASNGDMEYAAQYADKINANKKALADMSKAQLESAKTNIEMQGQLLGSVSDQGSWTRARQYAQSVGMDVSGLPEQYNPAVVKQLQDQALSTKDHLDQMWKQTEFAADQKWKGKTDARESQKFAYQQRKDANEGPDTSKNFEREIKLGDRYQRENQAFFEVRKARDNIMNALGESTASGDLAAATSIMKMLDPTSVVRESELEMSMNATGKLDQLRNYAQLIQNGQRLNPQQRKDFQSLANSMYSTAAQYNKQSRDRIGGMAQQYGLNNRNIMNDEPSEPPVQAQRGAQSEPKESSPMAFKPGQKLKSMPHPMQIPVGTVITVDGFDFVNTGKTWKREK